MNYLNRINEYINWIIKYTRYIMIHKYYVFLELSNFGIRYLWLGIIHDISKFSIGEFWACAKYFNDPVRTKETIEDFDRAWLQHIHNNKHHWQYWILINGKDEHTILDMPYKYIIEMICDWKGAAKVKGNINPNECAEWYNKHKDNIVISDKTKQTIESLLYHERIN